MRLSNGEIVEGHWVLLRRPDDHGGVQLVSQEVGDLVPRHRHRHYHVHFPGFTGYQIFNFRDGENLNIKLKLICF